MEITDNNRLPIRDSIVVETVPAGQYVGSSEEFMVIFRAVGTIGVTECLKVPKTGIIA